MKNFIVKYLSIMIILSMCIVCIPVISENVSAYETDDWLEGWTYRKAHIINQSASVTDGYVFGLKVYNGTGTDGTETVNGVAMGKVYINTTFGDFREIRITESDGTTILPYWIQNTTYGVSCVLWFRSYDDFSSSSNYYYIYYGNENAFPMSCGELVFTHFDDFENGSIWAKEGLVLPTPSTDWAYTEPTVIVENNAYIIDTDDDVFKMWFKAEMYSTGVTTIRYTESTDGYTWETPRTVLNTGESLFCPYVLKVGSTYYLYVHAGWYNVDCFTSTDGITWTKAKDNALSCGIGGSWDDHAIGNYQILNEGSGIWKMIYEAKSGSGQPWYAGLATSTDGLTWTKYASNPVLNSVTSGGYFIHKIDSTYHMLFHSAPDGSQLPTDIKYAYSTDLISWTVAFNGSPVFYRTEEYEGVGESEGQVGDVHIVEYKNQLYMFYEGVTTQSNHRGIALAGTGIQTLDMLFETSQNKVYNVSDVWDGDVEKFTISNGIGTFVGTLNDYNYTWWNTNVTGNTALVFYGKFIGAGSSSNVMVIGFNDVTRNDFCQINKGTVEVHRVQVTSFVTQEYDIDESNHYYELRRYATGSRLNVDGSLQTEITTQIYNNESYMMLQARQATTGFALDDIFVRPYYVDEPIHYTWEEFETYESETPEPEPEPSNPSDYLKVGKVLIVLAGAIPFIGFIIWALGKKD
jgi:predicted GH43/DUF377 family glycosyl hydrolase